MSRTTAIIPAYNAEEKLLQEAIRSVLHQKRCVREILVIDDGSNIPVEFPDDSGGIVRVIRQQNSGLGAARNRGIQEARSEFIAFLDADDIWLPDKMEKQEDCLASSPHAVACYTQCIQDDGFYGFGPYPAIDVHEREFIASLWASQFFPPSSTMVRTAVAKQVNGFRTGLRNGEDLEFLFRLLRVGSILQVPERLTGYRVHPGQITSDAYRKFAGGRDARRFIIEHLPDILERGGIPNNRFWDTHRNEIMLVYYRRDFKAARRLLWEFWQEHPWDFEALLKSVIARLPADWVTKFRGKVH